MSRVHSAIKTTLLRLKSRNNRTPVGQKPPLERVSEKWVVKASDVGSMSDDDLHTGAIDSYIQDQMLEIEHLMARAFLLGYAVGRYGTDELQE